MTGGTQPADSRWISSTCHARKEAESSRRRQRQVRRCGRGQSAMPAAAAAAEGKRRAGRGEAAATMRGRSWHGGHGRRRQAGRVERPRQPRRGGPPTAGGCHSTCDQPRRLSWGVRGHRPHQTRRRCQRQWRHPAGRSGRRYPRHRLCRQPTRHTRRCCLAGGLLRRCCCRCRRRYLATGSAALGRVAESATPAHSRVAAAPCVIQRRGVPPDWRALQATRSPQRRRCYHRRQAPPVPSCYRPAMRQMVLPRLQRLAAPPPLVHSPPAPCPEVVAAPPVRRSRLAHLLPSLRRHCGETSPAAVPMTAAETTAHLEATGCRPPNDLAMA